MILNGLGGKQRAGNMPNSQMSGTNATQPGPAATLVVSFPQGERACRRFSGWEPLSQQELFVRWNTSWRAWNCTGRCFVSDHASTGSFSRAPRR